MLFQPDHKCQSKNIEQHFKWFVTLTPGPGRNGNRAMRVDIFKTVPDSIAGSIYFPSSTGLPLLAYKINIPFIMFSLLDGVSDKCKVEVV